uniref:N-acetyltransferase domain-containing protein n=2 Tax=Hemiselmis andersenii TaxID=464988 RepID=A0A6U4N5A2_HEMAN|mmetsp:Transcript_11342/g.27439  ORF Transcript_11342/g.27439 Transcript_11342/m.27439 type:complete len:483 (+) Transcript_11342:48-1496(+)
MSESAEIVLVQVREGDSSLRHVRELVFEYTQFLLEQKCDVGSFQDLEVELKELPGRYSPDKGGAMLVAYRSDSHYAHGAMSVHRETVVCKDGTFKDADAIACVAIKGLAEEGVCEIKRLYVREPYRKLGLGALLTRAVIQQAKKLNKYTTVKLDTLERLPYCIAMYTKMGFRACPPYVPNPEGDAVYLELPLPVRAPSGAPEIEAMAEKLVKARNVPNSEVSDCNVSSLVQAYQLHSAISRAGETIHGWKVGATNDAAMQRLGLSTPFRAPLFSPNVRRGPCPVAFEELGVKLSALECEFAFRMAKALPPRQGRACVPNTAYTEEEVWAAVECLMPAIEIAATRSPSKFPPSPETTPSLVADFGLNGVLVLGQPIKASLIDRTTLSEATATLSREGGGKGMSAEGKGTNVMGSPLASLVWLVNSLSCDGVTLEEGAVVSTGAAALLPADKCPWGEKCRVKGVLGGLPAAAGDASVSIDLSEA